MQHIMTFESYQRYIDYQGGKWGSPKDLEEDAILTLKRLLPTPDEKWIDRITDQSTNKGIKFEFKIGKDTIHMFKLGNWRGEWEFYLNGKKTTGVKLTDYLETNHLDNVERFLKRAKGYDYNVIYIDSGKQYNDAQRLNTSILNLFDSLTATNKKKAIKTLKRDIPTKKKEIEQVFGSRA